MSCCPTAPTIAVGGSGDEDRPVQDTEIRRGESVECYMQRAGNSTGGMDDKPDYVPGKILNNDIPLSPTASVNVQFKLTPGSPVAATSWVMYDADDNQVANLGINHSVVLNGDMLAGTFASGDLGKIFKIKISAMNGTTEIDQRGFTFSPAVANGSNEIKLIHPLPGAVVTSRFGPRRPPTSGATSTHGGIDLAFSGGKVADVVAAADGEVIFTGFQNGGAGNYIKIKHLNGAGSHVCTTVYMHLAKIYVATGQRVVAGQKIGLEGNTGVGTGAHLHFECRLPSDMKIDPEPLINGSLTVMDTTPAGSGTPQGSSSQRSSDAVLTQANAEAKQAGCAPFGADYPKDPTETNYSVTEPPSPITDPFEKAWFFTMTHEVGPQWSTSSSSDPEVQAGSIDTSAQRKKVGYVNTPAYPGGETKFGIAQGPNASIVVRTIGYDPAKQTGFNNYWLRGPSSLVDTKPKTAIMLFDLNYLHGVGNANTIKGNANIGSLNDVDSAKALSAAQQTFMRNIVESNPQRQKYLSGWLKRSNELLSYVLSLS